jgi:hypothetical protein
MNEENVWAGETKGADRSAAQQIRRQKIKILTLE